MSESITITGRLGTDPELKFLPSGAAVCSFRVVTDRRTKDADGNWQSEDTTWWACTAWRQLAENIADSLSKGDLVIVRGFVKSREWETKEGEKRTSWEVDAKHVGPDLQRATAKVSRVERAQTGLADGKSAYEEARASLGKPAVDDPWATPGNADEIPF